MVPYCGVTVGLMTWASDRAVPDVNTCRGRSNRFRGVVFRDLKILSPRNTRHRTQPSASLSPKRADQCDGDATPARRRRSRARVKPWAASNLRRYMAGEIPVRCWNDFEKVDRSA